MLGPIEVVAEIDSTNRALLERARAGAPAGLVLVADHQTAGRGRLGRHWEAAPGAALLASVLLRPALPPSSTHLVTTAAGVAAVDACKELGADVALKWPNDVVVDDAKLAGILAEAVVTGDHVDAVVVGMGMNVRVIGLPEGAVALDELVAGPVDRDALLDRWLAQLEARLVADPAALLEDYRARSATLGRTVRVDLATGSIVGLAEEVTAEGHLIVADQHGRHEVAVGDVVHVRPEGG